MAEPETLRLHYNTDAAPCFSLASCSFNGVCGSKGLCSCGDGFTGADCSYSSSCLGTRIFASDSGSFSSSRAALASDSRYSNHVECVFVVSTARAFVQFNVTFNLEDTFDFLEVCSGDGENAAVQARLTGHGEQLVTVRTVNGTASMRLLADNKGRGMDFRATFLASDAACSTAADC